MMPVSYPWQWCKVRKENRNPSIIFPFPEGPVFSLLTSRALYHFYLACPEEPSVLNPTQNKQHPKIKIKIKSSAVANVGRNCCPVSCDHRHYTFCETFHIFVVSGQSQVRGKVGTFKWSATGHGKCVSSRAVIILQTRH